MKTDKEKLSEEFREILSADPEGKLHVERAHDWALARPNSVLYANLEWDDSVAGLQYRYSQIRQLIRVCVVVIPAPKGETIRVEPVREFVNPDPSRIDSGYQEVSTVATDPALRRAWLVRILRDIQGRLAGAEILEELDSLRANVEKLLRKYAPEE